MSRITKQNVCFIGHTIYGSKLVKIRHVICMFLILHSSILWSTHVWIFTFLLYLKFLKEFRINLTIYNMNNNIVWCCLTKSSITTLQIKNKKQFVLKKPIFMMLNKKCFLHKQRSNSCFWKKLEKLVFGPHLYGAHYVFINMMVLPYLGAGVMDLHLD